MGVPTGQVDQEREREEAGHHLFDKLNRTEAGEELQNLPDHVVTSGGNLSVEGFCEKGDDFERPQFMADKLSNMEMLEINPYRL